MHCMLATIPTTEESGVRENDMKDTRGIMASRSELEELFAAGVAELANAIKERSLTALQVVEFAIREIESYPKQEGDHVALNAFIHLNISKAAAIEHARQLDTLRQSERGPLFGVPIVVKDNIQCKRHRITSGCPAFDDITSRESADVVNSLESAGAVVIAKTNLHELSFGINSKNVTYGNVRNPHCPSRIAGGSSGGSGAAIGASLAPGGLGTDTGGSVRIPSALCGITGFRPTVGRYPTSGRQFNSITIIWAIF